ncbi:hypothetical protein HBB16_05505 [Pseudonocardia sp. MCCB 268]|nr:hypothetical protein [Pseudonocardia cytotoxica]
MTCPESLRNKRVVALDLGLMVAGEVLRRVRGSGSRSVSKRSPTRPARLSGAVDSVCSRLL